MDIGYVGRDVHLVANSKGCPLPSCFDCMCFLPPFVHYINGIHARAK